jgi:isoamylase
MPIQSNRSVVLTGKPAPLGATYEGAGTNFALFSQHATQVELCLFNSVHDTKEWCRILLPEKTHHVWHGFVPNLKPGQLYGYRVHGLYEPQKGFRFNPNKLLLDPYAKVIARPLQWADELFGYRIGDKEEDLSFDARDSAPYAPLACIADTAPFDWEGDQLLKTPWNKTIIYELHVKGFSKLNTAISESLRGTYAGLASDESINYLKSLGVTAVELMPIHPHVDTRSLVQKGLSNYWGYDTLAYLAPEPGYAAHATPPQEVLNEFRGMVKLLHREGIEVILDVVYNHTSEGNRMGPTLSLRGIDNYSYYRLSEEDKRFYVDFTGCGNTLNMQHPRTIQLITDSLRYWVLEMHVDGFRFDLAAALARELYEVNQLSAFFDIIHQDPVLSQVKLIAEPWDLGPGGYQVGNFPAGWSEWNGKYRDSVRQYWKGDEGVASEFITRFCGSSDLYQKGGRRPIASINFVTSHDGFSLQDLVSYNEKHNEANQEGNNDGDNHNLCWNCGVEGPTDNPRITLLRWKQVRNFISTLLLSQGVPMIRSGDELSHTQGGNNNPYCHDNEISWLHWVLNAEQAKFLEFTKKVIQLRHTHPAFRRRKFFKGRRARGAKIKDVTFFDPNGNEMLEKAWKTSNTKCLGVMLNGDAIGEIDEKGRPVVDDTLLVLMNAHHGSVAFVLPMLGEKGIWERILITSKEPKKLKHILGGTGYKLDSRSLSLFKLISGA